VRRALGPGVCTVSAAEMVAACSGGWLLARVSNDHGFVALIMMLGFAGSWP